MELRLIMVGKTEGGFIAAGLAHYLDRVRRSTPLQEVVVAESRRKEPRARVEEESTAILKVLRKQERLVLLDERGALLTSPAFAAQLGRWRDQGEREVAFVIGGAYGVDERVRERARYTLALSALTFPHQLVRVIFAEQLYRALSILTGGKYHHA
jgi:23S rRNA (pseudouridine1915-N3)-methyltransferase